MLTDIFADRYSSRVLWPKFTEVDSKLLNQCFRIVAEQLFPYWTADGKEDAKSKSKWTSLHNRLCAELGVDELSPRYYSFQTQWNGQPHTNSGTWSIDRVCKAYVCAPFDVRGTADQFFKERISFIELAFRQREGEVQLENASLPYNILNVNKALSGSKELVGTWDPTDGMRRSNKILNSAFTAAVDELNERMRRAGTPLNYHNGFFQIATDKIMDTVIERPFWDVVANSLWKNVDIDMKEALDRRDANDRDPAFYAARGLESAIKIISDQKGWTHGSEKGAHSYIDNLGAIKNGAFVASWERDALKSFFTEIRNPLGHGPGSEKMPQLSVAQTSWAIENSMSWIKSLIARM